MKNHTPIEIDYMRCLMVLQKYLAAIIVFALLIAVIGFGCTFLYYDTTGRLVDEYEATSSAYSKASDIYGQSANAVQYSDIAKSLKVAERAALIINDPSFDKYRICEMITAEYEESAIYAPSSVVIYIRARSTNGSDAILVANAVAKAFVTEVSLIAQTEDIHLLDTASASRLAFNLKKQLVLISGICAIAGLVLAIAFLLLHEILAFRLKYIADATLYGQLTVIGVIPVHD